MTLPTSSQDIILYLQAITLGSFGLGVIFLFLAILAFRRSRNDALWKYRRQANRRGFQWSILTALVLGISAAFCLTTFTVQYVEGQDTTSTPVAAAPSATLPPTDFSPTFTLDADILSPTALPIFTTQLTPTVAPLGITPTPIPQIIPEIYPPTPTPLPARVEIRALDDAITDNWQPIQPDTQFKTTLNRLYIFFAYEGMSQGMIWQQELWKDGELLQQSEQAWGVASSNGESFFFFGNPLGFAAGNYEIRLTLGTDKTPLASTQFMVLP